MAKAYEVIISGTYRNHKKEIVDYSGIKGIVPYCDEAIAKMHIKSRHAPMWIKADPVKFPVPLHSIREVFFDSLEPVTTNGNFSYVGKDIKEMTFEELQDLALAKDLRRIPLYKKTGLRQAQVIAYVAYDNEVLKGKLNDKLPEFNFAKLPPLYIDGNVRKDDTKKFTNEELIELEQKSTSDPKTTLSRADLEEIAKSKNIAFHPSISDGNLYKKLYS